MKTIEFVTKKKQGDLIAIPKKYADKVSGEFKVILILEVKPKKKVVRKREFKAFKVKTKGYKFNRDEIYKDMHNNQVIENSLKIINPFSHDL